MNKKYSFSYTFYAQKQILNLEEIHAVDVVVTSSGGLMATETLINLNLENNWNVALFQSSHEALEWLKKQ